MAATADSIRYVYEDDLLRISGVARSTRKNWVTNQLLEDPSDGRYRERDVIETKIIALLVRALRRLDDVRRVSHAELTRIIDALTPLGRNDYLTGLVEPRLLQFTLARSEGELGAAMRPFEPSVAVPFLPDTAEARAAFWRFAVAGEGSTDRRRRGGKPAAKRTNQSG